MFELFENNHFYFEGGSPWVGLENFYIRGAKKFSSSVAKRFSQKFSKNFRNFPGHFWDSKVSINDNVYNGFLHCNFWDPKVPINDYVYKVFGQGNFWDTKVSITHNLDRMLSGTHKSP